MLGLAKIFNANDKLLKQFRKKVEKINALEAEVKKLSDAKLQAKTTEFKERLSKGETLEDLLPEAFAVVREASVRTLKMRHFDVQLIGGMVLHRGMISEMKTGEGKTLVATLPVYLNALTGKGVHVVTVNDYLASRDANWMGEIYKFLGLTVGCLVSGVDDEARKAAYQCDILYGTNNEFGFDYLRDNLKFQRSSMVQREFNYAIVDEVDSILIDEARTPLIISGPTEDNSELYIRINRLIPKLGADDVEIDEKSRTAILSEEGTNKMESLLVAEGLMKKGSGLYDMENIALVHHVGQALKAHKLYTNDVDYLVKDGKVVIIDEFTGRMQEGRRFSEGLHQALEAKENVPVQNENQTLASVTFQNFFRLYHKLAGMTGTAMTERQEFIDIYGLDVVEIPTHVEVARKDEDDVIYQTAEEKYEAITKAIEEANQKKQPVLVGTVTIEKSELLSRFLTKKKIKHKVLNAKFHEQEALIVAQAGRPSAVTIATNMAGRGTDIKLGGNPEMSDEKWDVEKEKEIVLKAGGLFVLGTERHESRRIDNQLRGRSGRQGDPGLSRFYLSLEDDLMRIFGGMDRIKGIMSRVGMEKGESIAHPMISKTLQVAQRRVESRNYEVRKNLLKFDNVMNDQRKVVYDQRLKIMDAETVHDTVLEMRKNTVNDVIHFCVPPRSYPEQWDLERLEREVKRLFALDLPIKKWGEEEGIGDKEIFEKISAEIDKAFDLRAKKFPPNVFQAAEKQVLLITLDQLWKEHLHGLDNLRQGIGLRAYGQKDPLNEYKKEAFAMFDSMLGGLAETVTQRIAYMEPQPTAPDLLEEREREEMARSKQSRSFPDEVEKEKVATIRKEKIPRNAPCPCGSGKKYKHCHGALA